MGGIVGFRDGAFVFYLSVGDVLVFALIVLIVIFWVIELWLLRRQARRQGKS